MGKTKQPVVSPQLQRSPATTPKVTPRPAAPQTVARRPQPAGPEATVQRTTCACGGKLGADGQCAACRERKAAAVQRKMAVNAPGDAHEQEADQVARAHLQRQADETAAGPTAAPIQRKLDEAKPVQRKLDETTPVQRQMDDETETASIQRQGAGAAVPEVTPEIESGIEGARGGGSALPPGVQRSMENTMGADLSGVRVHSDGRADRLSRQLDARAFTSGQDIFFKQGEYNPGSRGGEELLAHEMAHTVQQGGKSLPSTIQRVGAHDPPFGYFPGERRVLEREAQEARERQRRHEAWIGNVNQQFGRDLTNQASTIGEERERTQLALISQRAAAMDAVISGRGWLNEALRIQGYSGPGLAEVKVYWAEALVAAELLQLATSRGELTPDARLAGLEVVPTFYGALGSFARAAEEAHQTHVQTENDRLRTRYEAQLHEHERAGRLSRESLEGMRGEPGAGAALGGQAIAHELTRPDPPTYLNAPPSISNHISAASARVYAADTDPEWSAVTSDVERLGNGLATLVVASLPTQAGEPGADIRTGVEYLEQLDIRLAGLERTNPLAVRIPAVFYPKDETINRRNEQGEVQLAPKNIPWQFYLINTGVTSHDQPARSGGEWILKDLTSGQLFENRAPASDLDSARLQQGEAVDPPIGMFSELNTRIRFPEGFLFFTLPSNRTYRLETTEPWSLSDWLSAIGMALAAIGLVAAVVATGGAAAPAAVAFYAGVGAAAAGVGSTLANLHERNVQGILTSSDVDEAMIAIGIDVITVASMGLGRLVVAPRAVTQLGLTGERFIALRRVTQAARVGALGGDLYQGYSLTSGLISSFNALDSQPGLTREERDRMRAQLIRRALISGALLTIAIRGDIQDVRSGVRVTDIGPDGVPVAHSDTDAPRQQADAPGASTAAHTVPHADMAAGAVPGTSGRISTDFTIGPQSHSLTAAGTGQNRDFYFCSDLCTPIVQRLQAVARALPQDHPFRPAIQDMLRNARGASRRLKLGQLSQEEADAVARQLSDRIGRLSNDSQHFAALMNTDPTLLRAHAPAIRQRLANALEEQRGQLAVQSGRQAANRGSSRGRDPLSEPDRHSPIETDILGGVNIQAVARPGWRLVPLRFDVGNFSHTYAEALISGLPRGLRREVRIDLPDGTIGRADRVRFIVEDGHIVGAYVYEIKPNTPGQIEQGNEQLQRYIVGLKAKIEADLREAGIAVPSTTRNGQPLYGGEVLTYDREQMRAVLRAVRQNPRDAASLAEDEAIARQVFGATP